MVERLLDRFGALPTPDELKAVAREPGLLTPSPGCGRSASSSRRPPTRALRRSSGCPSSASRPGARGPESSSRRFLLGEPLQLVQRTAELVRARALEDLRLQPHLVPGRLGQQARAEKRCSMDVRSHVRKGGTGIRNRRDAHRPASSSSRLTAGDSAASRTSAAATITAALPPALQQARSRVERSRAPLRRPELDLAPEGSAESRPRRRAQPDAEPEPAGNQASAGS
jgi:hypothetical protein